MNNNLPGRTCEFFCLPPLGGRIMRIVFSECDFDKGIEDFDSGYF